MTTLLKPPKLSIGDCIGVVAPSFPFPTKIDSDYSRWYENGKKELEKMGFFVKEGKNLKKVKWWFAGTPEERAGDINSMFADQEVKAIIAHDGGQSAIAVIEHIDYDLVKNNPKPFLGFSDITNIHSALFTKINLVGFHMDLLSYGLGWVWNEIDPVNKEKGEKMFLDILTSTNGLGKITPLTKWECWREGSTDGILFGGNLSLLSSLVGTKFFPSIDRLKGSILFWEMDNTPSYRIERCLYQIKYTGVFDVVSGMLIGKLPDIKRTAWEGFEEPTPKQIIMESLKNYNFPVLAEVDFGHKTVNIPMPIGIKARMNAKELVLEFLEPAVK